MVQSCCQDPVQSKLTAGIAANEWQCFNNGATMQLEWDGSGWRGSQTNGYSLNFKCLGLDSEGKPTYLVNWSQDECGASGTNQSYPDGTICQPFMIQVRTALNEPNCCTATDPPPHGDIVIGIDEGVPIATSLPTDPIPPPPCNLEDPCCDVFWDQETEQWIDQSNCSSGRCNVPTVSRGPIRYGTGAPLYEAKDLSVSGYGVPWGHTRSFRTQITGPETIGQGYNWQVKQWPFLVQGPTGLVGTEITQVVIQGNSDISYWFDKIDGEWTPRFYVKSSLEHDEQAGLYRLTELSGTVTEFDDFTGMFSRRISPGGNTISVTGMSANGANFSEVEREYTVNGVTTTEKFQYDYLDTGDLLLESVILLRQVGGAAWKNVSRVNYEYYGNDVQNGSDEDLKTVTTQEWDGSAWQDTGTSYYRYYKQLLPSGSSSSSSSSSSAEPPAHLLKYIVDSEAYAKLAADPNVTDPLTATDAQVALYADYYFEYDANRRVTKERIQGGSQTFTFSYEQSSFEDGVNSWKTKTTETLPDGDQNIVYCNYAAQPMLRIRKSGTSKWYRFYKYDSSSNLILQASSAAISGYDDQYADLLHEVSGSYQYLNNSDGLINTFTYHSETNWLASQSVQEGENGTAVKVLEKEYIACENTSGSSSSSSSSSASTPAYFLSKLTEYPSDTDQTEKIVTSYSYSWYEGTCQVKEKTTTLPVISTAQNGSGTSNTTKEYFDIYGYNTWKMDARGFITRAIFDIPTGAPTQQIMDVDTGIETDAPSGWTTPSGGGLNLITDFEHDDRGRITQSLGPGHDVDLSGTSTTIRTASWIVYSDGSSENVVKSAQGYVTGSSPSYTYTLANPVNIIKSDKNGKTLEQIQATRASTSGKLTSSDTFAQSSYTRWQTMQYADCCHLASQRVYHTIPASGEGTSGTNYDETTYGYDAMKQRNRTVTPGGTITRVVYDARGMVTENWVGTDDTGATASDPSGGGATGNNMVQISANQYDDGSAGGNGNLTKQTQYADATDTRVTNLTYDFRNRQTETDGEIDYFQKVYYDNLNRITKTERYDTTSSGNLIARSETKFDDLSRVYQSIRYGVDPLTGTVGNSLTSNTWFDATGNTIKSLPAGSEQFTKITYDSLGRRTKQFLGYDLDETTYADASTVTGDTILQQSETVYNDASSVIETNSKQRYHDAPASQTGELQNPSTTPKARVTYNANYSDGIGRTVASANYGTNGGTTLSRPSTIPTRSDTILVTSMEYNDAGNQSTITDPASMVVEMLYDDAGRETSKIMNPQDSSSSSSAGGNCQASDDSNVTVTTAYNADGNVESITAENSVTGDQTTQYIYGTTLSDSEVASSLLKRKEIYPDSVDSSDVILFSYNRQQQTTTVTDQGGTVHSYDYDKLGRQTQDRITTLGTGVDGAVRRITSTYDVRGLREDLTSYDNATVGSGTIVNDVQFAYNDFSQLTTDYQSHSGAVNVSTTPKVQYGYDSGSDNTIRPTTLTYPDGRVITYDYGTSSGIDDASSRIASLIDDDASSTHLVDYSYLGSGTFVIADDTEPETKWTLADLSGTNDPDTGDIYSGFDRFGRVKDNRWYDYGNSTDTDRIKYGYNRAGNRTYRENTVADALGKHFDELYGNDAIQRLKDLERGTLNGTQTAITNKSFAECWSLDPTGNWKGYLEDDNGDGTWDLNQSRTSNDVNEITDITETAGPSWTTPVYNKPGNMTTMPQPGDPASSYTATYDAWNRLVKIADGANTVAEYEYDGSKRRTIQKTYAAGVLDETRYLYYSKDWQVLEERVDSSTNPEQQHIWGLRYIDDCVLRDRDTTGNGVLNERLYALQDANWNVDALINSSGVVQERFAYLAYGSPTFFNASFVPQVSSSSNWQTLYCGYHWDETTELFHVRNRVYHSDVGTWGQRDPLGLIPGINLYEYVNAQPISATDKYGLLGVVAAGCLGGLTGGAIWNGVDYFLGNTTICEGLMNTICSAGIGCIVGAMVQSFSMDPSWGAFFACMGIGGLVGLLSQACQAIGHGICGSFGCDKKKMNLNCLLADIFTTALGMGISCTIPTTGATAILAWALGVDISLIPSLLC